MGRAFTLTYSEVAEAFGWVVGGEDWNAPSDLDTTTFWNTLTGVDYQGRGGNKVNSIVHPCFRMVYKLLNDSLFLSGEVGAVSIFGIKHFWALCPEGAGTPPWVEIFVTGCLREQGREKGKITFGGMVTLLANAVGVVFTDDCMRLHGGFQYDPHFLQSAHFLDFTTGAYIIKGQAPLPLPPTPANLFVIPNGVGTRRLRKQVLRKVGVDVRDEDDDDDGDDEDDDDDSNNNEEEGNQEGGGFEHHQQDSSGGGFDSWRPYVDAQYSDMQTRMAQYWQVQDERWDLQQQRWATEDRRWQVQDERWDQQQQRWAMEDRRWYDFTQHFQGLTTRDPAEEASLEARRQEEQRRSQGYTASGPGSSES